MANLDVSTMVFEQGDNLRRVEHYVFQEADHAGDEPFSVGIDLEFTLVGSTPGPWMAHPVNDSGFIVSKREFVVFGDSREEVLGAVIDKLRGVDWSEIWEEPASGQ